MNYEKLWSSMRHIYCSKYRNQTQSQHQQLEVNHILNSSGVVKKVYSWHKTLIDLANFKTYINLIWKAFCKNVFFPQIPLDFSLGNECLAPCARADSHSLSELSFWLQQYDFPKCLPFSGRAPWGADFLIDKPIFQHPFFVFVFLQCKCECCSCIQ